MNARTAGFKTALVRRLLATSSLVAVMAAAATPQALAANCTTTLGPGTVAGCSNPGVLSGINITNATVTSAVINNGTIAPGGINVVNSTIAGTIDDAGTITGGISLDSTSKVTSSTFNAINVSGAAGFNGGINNSGTISGQNVTAINIQDVSTFSGGITNRGTISANGGTVNGFDIANISTFTGGIVNSGAVSGAGTAVSVNSVTNFSGGIVNSGSISSQNGLGIFIQGAATFLGGITNSGTISSGQTAINLFNSVFGGGISNSGTISSTLSGHSAIRVGVATFLGSITNSGTISSKGIGVNVTGAGATVFTSGAGASNVANTGTISGTTGIRTANSGAISIFNSGTITGTGGTAIDFLFGSGGSTLTLGPGFVINGIVAGNISNDAFQLGGNGTGTFDLSTIGATKQYQVFTTFNVVSGTWVVTNTFGQAQAWNVNGGTLAGTGTLNSVNVNAGGTLESGLPGTAGGALHMSGNLVLASAATYLVNISPTAASLALVTGNATVAGTAQVALQSGFYAAGSKFTILTANGGVSGTFGSLTTPSSVSASLCYDTDDVFLTVKSNPLLTQLPTTAPTNIRNVAAAIDNAVGGGATLPAGLGSLFGLPAQTLQNDLAQLTGEAGTGAQESGFQMMNSFLSLLFDPFAGAGNGGGGPAMGFAPEHAQALPPDVALAYDSVLKAPPLLGERPWNMWGAAYGGKANINGDPAGVGSNDLTTRAGGFAAGLDYRMADTVVGFALAGGGTSWGLAAGLGGGRSDVFQAGLYGSRQYGAAYVSGALAYASHWVSTSRTVTFAGPDTLSASFNAQSFGGRLEGGYRIPSGMGFSAIPYAAVQAESFWTPSYSESGALGAADPFALTYNTQTATLVRSELGSRFDQIFAQADGGGVDLFGRAAWAHDWQSNPNLTASFIGLPTASFVVNGATPPSDLALATAGAEWRTRSGWSFLAKFDGEFAAGAQTYTGTARIKYSW